MKAGKVVVPEYLLEMLAKGQIRYVKDKKIGLDAGYLRIR